MPVTSDEPLEIKPFLKWAGGKRWLIARHSYLFPIVYANYHEPFLGSGAVFFHLQPKKAYLSDTNARLIDCFEAIKQDWKSVRRYLLEFQKLHSDRFYYSMRDTKYRSKSREAAKFIYLNRTCFNGIYRENLNGVFNVPRGTKNSVVLDDDNFRETASQLRKVQFGKIDFAVAIAKAKDGDFVFVDPPYTVRHNNNGFVKYNQKIFNWDDQIRLRDHVRAAADRGVRLLVTNANHPSILDLYSKIGRANPIERSSVISGAAEFRGTYSEIAITIGYDILAGETSASTIDKLKLCKGKLRRHSLLAY
jgi:DNA adenine methylase